ncbi:MAG: molybdopterin molybdotransferase MoeA [Phycisphaerales bacterium]
MSFRGEEYRFGSPREAVEHVGAIVGRVGVERVGLVEASGRVLAEDAKADRPSPAVSYSAMDGFAARLVEVKRAAALPIRSEVRIGREPPALAAGVVTRIVTGGAIPAGADVVVPVEDVQERDDAVTISDAGILRCKAGQFIRVAGENAKAGEVVLRAGTLLTATAVGTLAAIGIARPAVWRRVRVAVLVTGDELVAPEETPDAWQVRNSSGAALEALLGTRPWVAVAKPLHLRDDPATMGAAVSRAIAECDAVVMTGGVSMGHRDFVRDVLERNGVRIELHGMPQRPGKPVLVGIATGDKAVFGLPGNPVSSLVTCRRMVAPVLARVAGMHGADSVPRVEVANPDLQTIPLWWQRLVRVDEHGRGVLLEARGSGDVVAAGKSDGFVEMPPGKSGAGPWSYFAWSA